MLDAALQGFGQLFSPVLLLTVLGGALIGIIVGVLPTISGVLTLALMLPIIYHLPPEIGLGLAVAMLAVTETGGSMTSILINVPGTGVNVCTMIDGYPMTLKGESSRAIGAALFASATGGVTAGIATIFIIPAILPIVMAFMPGDSFVLIVFALTLVTALVRGSALKGLAAGFFGVLLSLVGFYGATGTDRLTFGSVFLSEGFDLVPVSVGLFGIASLFSMVMRGEATIAKAQAAKTKIADAFQGVRDVFHYKMTFLRTFVFAYFIGIMPGVGGQVATFGSYSLAKQASKHPETFGTGDVEGIIAPEIANNTERLGALLCTLAFGIPGSASMALFLAAIVAVNIVPGPSMMTKHLDLTFVLVYGAILANVFGAAICFVFTPQLMKVIRTPVIFLFPTIMALIYVGVFSDRNLMLSIIIAIVFGLIGLVMAKYDYSRPAFILGFVLGGLLEHNLWVSLKLQGPFFFTSPISIFLMVLMFLMYALPHVKKVAPAMNKWFRD